MNNEIQNELALVEGMTANQKTIFMSQMESVRKNENTGLCWCLFAGGFGAHRFYLGQPLLGLAYMIFCWTWIPLEASVIELFLIKGRVRDWNMKKAIQIAESVKIAA